MATTSDSFGTTLKTHSTLKPCWRCRIIVMVSVESVRYWLCYAEVNGDVEKEKVRQV